MPKISDLEQHLKIDKLNLDEEVVSHSELYWKAAEAAALARSRLDQVKADLDWQEAELDRTLRDKAAKAGSKLTERSISMDIERDEERMKKYQEFLAQKLRVEKWDQLRESFRQRGYMLRELVSMHVTGHYQLATENLGDRMKDARAEYNRERMVRERRKG